MRLVRVWDETSESLGMRLVRVWDETSESLGTRIGMTQSFHTMQITVAHSKILHTCEQTTNGKLGWAL